MVRVRVRVRTFAMADRNLYLHKPLTFSTEFSTSPQLRNEV